ncbi:glycosyl hydrolase [Algoriphagus sp.]|uniref:glycoside hydrolase family 26 protein n=1 Tax=Algoriphagus sp. TaxID=1872435 RepID=UPI002609BC35|nr:glycosyl hydrolase [Algoriphagus sp.]
MKSPIKRIVSFFFVLAIAMMLILGIAFVGKESSGPIEDFFQKVSSSVSKLEEDYILKKRSETRASKLDWLAAYQQNPNLLKNPDSIFLGAYDNQAIPSFQPIIDLEDSLNLTFPIIHFYTAWGSKREQRFPIEQIRAITTLGSIPLVTWEPWLNDFSEEDFPTSASPEDRNKSGLQDIAAGLYDLYLTQWARDAKNSQTTILLRMGHEMNDPYRYPWGPQNNQPEDFIAAWRHVVDLFRKQGADNVLWVWAPHLAYGYFKEYYPGEQYVDWIGTGTLNYGTVAPWSQWWSFDEIFAKYYEEFAAFKKPILLAEFGSLAVGGNRPAWYGKAFKDFPHRFPQVKGLIFFHNKNDATTTFQSLNWYLIQDTETLTEIKKQLHTW